MKLIMSKKDEINSHLKMAVPMKFLGGVHCTVVNFFSLLNLWVAALFVLYLKEFSVILSEPICIPKEKPYPNDTGAVDYFSITGQFKSTDRLSGIILVERHHKET